MSRRVVVAGQLYRSRANAQGRYRYILVSSVRAGGEYALCREVSIEGVNRHGRDSHGLNRADDFTVQISGGGLGYGYTRVEDES